MVCMSKGRKSVKGLKKSPAYSTKKLKVPKMKKQKKKY